MENTNKTEVNSSTDTAGVTETEKITLEFFKRRFPNKDIAFEKKCGYFQTWERRFESDNPEAYMDYESLAVWNIMQGEMENEAETSGLKFVEDNA